MSAALTGQRSLDRRDEPPPAPLKRLGALRAWRDALAGRTRGDPLSPAAVEILRQAACWEQSAVEAEAQGFHESAREDIEQAAACLDGFLHGEPDTERGADGKPKFPVTDRLIEDYVRSLRAGLRLVRGGSEATVAKDSWRGWVARSAGRAREYRP